MHAIDQLLRAVQRVEPYPPGIVAVPELIARTAFFPGGAGLWNPTGDGTFGMWPHRGVMVLGHDFDSERGYQAARRRGTELGTNKTWRELLPLLAAAGINPERCFFTNAYMGLRKGKRAVGPYVGAADPAFVDRCQQFFLTQVQLQEPALVLALGSRTPGFLAALAPELHRWRGCDSFAALDAANPLVANVRFANTRPCVVAVLTHPSYRSLNVTRRRFASYSGHAAELEILRQAVDLSAPTAAAV